jgi:hypothetical protein
MKAHGVSFLEVAARWGYSELIDSPASQFYSGDAIEPLRRKRRDNVQFTALTESEKEDLAISCREARPMLFQYMHETDIFDMIEIDRRILANAVVPHNVWYPESDGRFVSFSEYMSTSHHSADDPRNVVLTALEYQLPDDPLTFGRSGRWPLLVDGFHRAAQFWKFGPADSKLCAYIPRVVKDGLQ